MYRTCCPKAMFLTACAALTITASAPGKSLKAPTGMFKDLNDEILGDAIIINGKQLFIDDYIIGELTGAEKTLNQPVKHPKNPLIVPDKPWEKRFIYCNGTVVHDTEEGIYKMWVMLVAEAAEEDIRSWMGLCWYGTSPDGVGWEKPIVDKEKRNNLIRITPQEPSGFCPSVFKDMIERDPQRRYKMLYLAEPDWTAKSLCTCTAYSPDGIHWTTEPQNPLIPYSDTQPCPYWDGRLGRYVAYLRYGPPNSRLVSRIESEDFVHWSPKVTVIDRSKLDAPFNTKHYGMRIRPYAGVYLGLLVTYHGETIKQIPKDKLWMDKMNVQLTFSRNGITWLRVGKHGAIPTSELNQDRDWKTVAKQATFIPYGEHGKDWDWGRVQAFQPPLVIKDEIRIYYAGHTGRHWAKYHGDTRKSGIGLATLRLDGFVSINAEDEGTMTTKRFVFIGDTIEVNANAAGGSILVEALDPAGKVIEGFAKKDCTAITTDSVRHVLKWKGKADCQLIQARPIKLRFCLKKAKLYSFTPRIQHKHYIQSYD